MYQKVEDIKRPLKYGEIFLVPCIVREEDGLEFITPVINHPHNDKENGQTEVHYHVDYRFIKIYKDLYEMGMPIPVNEHSVHRFVEHVRPEKDIDGEMYHILLPVVNTNFLGSSSVHSIRNSRLKHKCIYKGKCPHRGYDLSQVEVKDGKITCPLHGLQFDAKTGKLITFEDDKNK